jgi:hypothetical protein
MYSIKDNFKLTYSNQNIQELKDTYTQNPGNGLFVRIKASHAGMINRNNFLYLPDKMKNGVSTFLQPFKKPILINHNEDSDPIGRVVASKYVDTSIKVKDAIKDAIDTELLDFVTGKMSFDNQVTYIQDTLYDKMLDDPNFEGLGFAEIVAHITDKAAVEKFLDERYLTGSVAAGTNRAMCSVCKNDWSSQRCEHVPGKVYDKKKMFLIAGDFTYEHWAVVNTPADGHSQVSQISEVPLIDSTSDTYTIEDSSVELLKNYSEEEIMADNVEVRIEEKIKVVDFAPVVTEESFDDFMTRVLDTEKKLTEEDSDKLYDLMVAEMKEAKLDIQDAVLSSEKRKKLAKSAFCGPGKSFPVPDCAHVTAARRLVGKYKGPGSKDAIMACVDRKAKAMGCDKAMKDEVVEKPEVKDAMTHISILQALVEVVRINKWAYDEEKPLTEEQLAMIQELVTAMAQLATVEKMTDAILSEKAGLSQSISDRLESTLLDEVIKLETQLGEVRDSCTKLQEETQLLKSELSMTVKESEVLRDAAIFAKTLLRQTKLDKLSLLKSLKDAVLVDSSSLSKLTDSAIDTELESLTTFELTKVVDKLSDGLSRTPTEIVDNPIKSVDNSKENGILITDEIKKIEEKYLELAEKRSIKQANLYMKQQMERLQKEGKLVK